MGVVKWRTLLLLVVAETLIFGLWFSASASLPQLTKEWQRSCERAHRSSLCGTALTIQTTFGFLLTMISIRIIPPMVDLIGWEWAFVVLSPGPVFGIWSMLKLRRLPEAERMASGNR